jgi:hypothetical protein
MCTFGLQSHRERVGFGGKLFFNAANIFSFGGLSREPIVKIVLGRSLLIEAYFAQYQ